MVHVACYVSGAKAEFYLTRIIDNGQLSLHVFQNMEELLTLGQRFMLDMIFVGITSSENEEVMRALDMVRFIKNHTFLAIIPTVMYHPEPDDTTLIAAFENGAEDFFTDAVAPHIAHVKTHAMIDRAFRDLSVNPSSRLPGPAIIEREIERQIEFGHKFAVCYADLDNFKAYNDYYGYYYGDRIIKLTARIIKDIVFDLCREGFVGHIGGDDFVFIIPAELVPKICKAIIHTFDTIMPYRYEEDDRRRGQIITKNRKDVDEVYGIMTISIAVVINRGRMFKHIGEMSHMLADLKKYAKTLEGSNYVVERRKKY